MSNTQYYYPEINCFQKDLFAILKMLPNTRVHAVIMTVNMKICKIENYVHGFKIQSIDKYLGLGIVE